MAILVTHVPGGLGVLEAVVSAILPGAAAIGGLIVFRAIYFLLPLLLGLPAFAISEVAVRRGRKKQLEKRIEQPPQSQAQLL
ncbi:MULTISPECIES: hypothetical protein [unclassified Rhizobium]|uniref:hypothetical protein n=1 Tax=unclassified Rhizobium TaxID=2613769 RepID=UPI00160BD7F4|nr:MULTISPECIES: hypothetical protein [unclassified Rhizobium]MBB3542102.1 uncharacterized membrane protein YbhN (UPF0104 family) [Rhizobium sp. BK399]MCS3740317.1 uncharacterized membrane protein YbhN (UPF0104 family) [Rhizobium sp. BK661]MCS4094226.1 uncharacterized membrane protein YbhN (UPF0104 family) [Rhizobium sp. BK176]